ncbi:ABC transporter substrate-binding protein [Bacteroidota bacterium]
MKKSANKLSILLLVLFISFCFSSCKKEIEDPEEYTIGALLPLTGDSSSDSEEYIEALEIGINQINEQFKQDDINKIFTLLIEDTETNPEIAKIKLVSMLGQGIKAFIGPITSAEIMEVKETINDSESLIISPSSTLVDLAVENDNIFRVVADDSKAADAIVDYMWDNGIRNLALFYRYDAWGIGLTELIKQKFTEKGGNILGSADYETLRESLIQEGLDSISNTLSSNYNNYDLSSIAVHLSCFDEGHFIFELAANDPELRKVRWYGTDGFVENQYVLEVPEAIDFAIDVQYCAPIYGVENSILYNDIEAMIEDSIGYKPKSYSILAYDAIKVAALTLSKLPEGDDIDMFRNKLVEEFENYNGASGTIDLNSAGDRNNANYFVWQIQNKENPQWVKIGTINQ